MVDATYEHLAICHLLGLVPVVVIRQEDANLSFEPAL
jgi:hypothetical protein